jgi:hypothetical protein
VKLARLRKIKVTCFLSCVENRSNTNINIIMCTYKYTQNMFPKVGLLEETRGGGKDQKNIDSE